MQASPLNSPSDSPSDVLDCVIIGAGAAGLTAATYLARFRRRIVVIDGKASRLLSIPTSHNYPGFANGIHGNDILDRMRAQVAHYGVRITSGTADRMERAPDGRFIIGCGSQQWHARTVIMATGVVDVDPDFPEVKRAVQVGCVRYCPICDGFEAIGKNVAVLGRGRGGFAEALFVKHYADKVSLLTLGDPIELDADDKAKPNAASIHILDEPVASLRIGEDQAMEVELRDGTCHRFDVLYAALGTIVNSGMAQLLGAKSTPNGELIVNSHQQTSIEGLYAAGDIVKGLNQITVAMGHAAIAATAVHNRLNAWQPD